MHFDFDTSNPHNQLEWIIVYFTQSGNRVVLSSTRTDQYRGWKCILYLVIQLDELGYLQDVLQTRPAQHHLLGRH